LNLHILSLEDQFVHSNEFIGHLVWITLITEAFESRVEALEGGGFFGPFLFRHGSDPMQGTNLESMNKSLSTTPEIGFASCASPTSPIPSCHFRLMPSLHCSHPFTTTRRLNFTPSPPRKHPSFETKKKSTSFTYSVSMTITSIPSIFPLVPDSCTRQANFRDLFLLLLR
jgi:hypothetical protein